MAASKQSKVADNAQTMGIGVALAIVITQALNAYGIDLGGEIVGPLGVVLKGVIDAVKSQIGGDDA